MALQDYVGKSQFWTKMKRAVGTQLLTSVNLYDEAIMRAFDRGRWVYDQVLALRTDLARQSKGTQAVKQGSVDLSTLTFADVGGDLNGLTVLAQADTGGLKSVTFGDGAGLAPTSPADVVSQCNAIFGGQPVASLDSGNKLMIKSTTTGGSSTITTTGGTALALLGLTVGAGVAGSATGNSGAEQIGVPSITGAGSAVTLPAGTLLSMLQEFLDRLVGTPLLDTELNSFTGDMDITGKLDVHGAFTAHSTCAVSGATTCSGTVTCTNTFTVSGAGKTTTLSQDTVNISGAQCNISGATGCAISTDTTFSKAIIRTGANAILRERNPIIIAANNASPTITLAWDSVQTYGPSVDQTWELPAAPSYATEIECLVFAAGSHDVTIVRPSSGHTIGYHDHGVGNYSWARFKTSNVTGSWDWVLSASGGAFHVTTNEQTA